MCKLKFFVKVNRKALDKSNAIPFSFGIERKRNDSSLRLLQKQVNHTKSIEEEKEDKNPKVFFPF